MVEGFFDAITVQQTGCGAVAALMGLSISRPQADLRAAYTDRVVLMLDGDEAGHHGTTTVVHALGDRLPLSSIVLGHGCQPDQP